MSSVGVTKTEGSVDPGRLDFFVREELNRIVPRVMVVLDPVKLVITNYPNGRTEELDAENNPENADAGSRPVTFGREIYIEREDFAEEPPPKYFRLAPGREVRLKHAYYVTCTDVVKDAAGAVVEIRCTYDPQSRGGESPDGRKVKGTLHWVNAADAVNLEVRLFDRLFTRQDMVGVPDDEFRDYLNPDARTILTDAMGEASIRDAKPGARFQFLRQGYFIADDVDSAPGKPVFNRTTGLRDSWAKVQRQAQG